MPRIKDICKLSYLRLLYDVFVLSLRITFAMIVATYRMLVPPRAKDLLGETVLITGAGHGIGRELAIQLASLGCIIICWDVDSEANQSTINMVAEIGGEVYGWTIDVSKKDEVRFAARSMRERGVPEVSILINNAAILHHYPFLKEPYFHFTEKTFDINVLSNFWTIQTFLPDMIRNRKGHIVCVSSMCGIYGVSQKVAYCSSKFAVRGLMEALHEELRLDSNNTDIKITTVYPFYVDTGLARDPKYRFPYIFGALSPKYVAGEIINAIRRNYTEYSIPRCLFTLNSINRMVPETVMRLILDFLADVERKHREKLATSKSDES